MQQDDHHPPYALPIGGCCLIAITRTKSSSLPVQIQFVGGGEKGRVIGHEKIMGKLAGKCGGYIIITQEEANNDLYSVNLCFRGNIKSKGIYNHFSYNERHNTPASSEYHFFIHIR